MGTPAIRAIRTPGLGDTSYVVVADGVALVVDPQRDVERFVDVLSAEGAELRAVFETHVHNDYVSGGRHLADLTGADLVLPAAAGAAYRHSPAFHLEDLTVGPFVVRPLHTPGHTPEHTSYLLLVEGEPVAVFSGGSLLVGSAGRTDLLGSERAAQLARLQHGSVHRLASLPEEVGLFPTHGEGSFCVASGTGKASSTIGDEVRTSPVLAYPGVEAFVEGQLAALVPYPRYYAHMGPANTLGVAPIAGRQVARLTPAEVDAAEATIVDLRPRRRFASGHIPGSLGIELRDDFGVWVGWLVPFGTPLVLVVDTDTDVAEAVVQLARIGFDDIVGVVVGLDEWDCEGRPLSSYRTATVDEVLGAWRSQEPVLDVRAPDEWDEVALPGTSRRYVPDLVEGNVERSGVDTSRPVWVVCATGYRASMAASLLEREGVEPVVLIDGGVSDLAAKASARAVI